MARLFADENFPLPVVEELRGLGHDVLTIQEAGMANQRFPDEAILRFANADNRAVLTLNRKHFVRLHNTSSDHAGIIACTVDLDFAGQAVRIQKAVESRDSLDEELIRINRPV
jgi:predicted nuclease of predicted toxin-antitoxin system